MILLNYITLDVAAVSKNYFWPTSVHSCKVFVLKYTMTSFLLTFAKITNLASERYARKPILDANQVRVKLTNILKKRKLILISFS